MSSITAGTTSTTTLVHSGDTTGSLVFKTNDTGSGGTTAVTIDTSQNVLVGQTTNTNNVRFALAGSGGTANDFMINSNSSYSEIQSFNAKPLYLNRQGNNVIVCSGGDNLLVGTTSANGKLTVNSASSSGIASAITSTSQLTTVGLNIQKADNNSTTSNWFQAFTINGGATGSGIITANGASAAAFGSFSDSRLKENIVNLPSQLANIMSLRPVEFDYIESMGGGHQIGFIAQEVKEIYSDLVSTDQNGMYTLTDLNKNDARLIKCIQEMKALIDQQAETINALTARVVALESRGTV